MVRQNQLANLIASKPSQEKILIDKGILEAEGEQKEETIELQKPQKKELSDEIERLGGKGICYRTGNSYTKAAVRDFDLAFGGELSGHVYFRDRFPGFDSGLYAGLRMVEILSHTTKSLDELAEGIPVYYSTPELKIATKDDIKFSIIQKVADYAKNCGYHYLDIDGVKILFDDGWALVRASNTGPNITVRFEAKTKDRLENIQTEFTNLLKKLLV